MNRSESISNVLYYDFELEREPKFVPSRGFVASLGQCLIKERQSKVSLNYGITPESYKTDLSLIDQGKKLMERIGNYPFFTITKTFTREKFCTVRLLPRQYQIGINVDTLRIFEPKMTLIFTILLLFIDTKYICPPPTQEFILFRRETFV